MRAALAAEAALALVAFVPPTIVMGALFSHLSRRAQRAGRQLRARARREHAGRGGWRRRCSACCWCRALGPKFALLLIAAGYLALAVAARVACADVCGARRGARWRSRCGRRRWRSSTSPKAATSSATQKASWPP